MIRYNRRSQLLGLEVPVDITFFVEALIFVLSCTKGGKTVTQLQVSQRGMRIGVMWP